MDAYPFKEFHLLSFFEFYEQDNLPVDTAMSLYFRQNRALGSKDKKFIAENGYGMMRWKGLLDHSLEASPTWEARWLLFKDRKMRTLLVDGIPFHVRCSAPKFLAEKLQKIWGDEKTLRYFHLSNSRAPLTVRVNASLSSRDDLLEKWRKEYPCIPTKQSPYGITLKEHIQLFTLPEFKNGLFEVQDEGSQLAADLVTPKPGDHILDYCAGSGGKSLAFAHKTGNSGQIYLYDIRRRALAEAKKRMKRAKIQNYQIFTEESLSNRKWKGKMNWVFVDAPCSGTGTLRRNPDLKWKIDEQMLTELKAKQRSIFEKALKFVRPGGHIVYCTCSVLPEENEEQIKHLLSLYPVTVSGEPFSTFPTANEMDGFYACVLKKH